MAETFAVGMAADMLAADDPDRNLGKQLVCVCLNFAFAYGDAHML
jgi:hypothetical protein